MSTVSRMEYATPLLYQYAVKLVQKEAAKRIAQSAKHAPISSPMSAAAAQRETPELQGRAAPVGQTGTQRRPTVVPSMYDPPATRRPPVQQRVLSRPTTRADNGSERWEFTLTGGPCRQGALPAAASCTLSESSLSRLATRVGRQSRPQRPARRSAPGTWQPATVRRRRQSSCTKAGPGDGTRYHRGRREVQIGTEVRSRTQGL